MTPWSASWIQGDFGGAERHYLTPKSGAQSYRKQPDFDRLIKLAFYREQWDEVIQRFAGASFSLGFSKGRVCCGGSETTARPFLEMLAIALSKLRRDTPGNVLTVLTSAFGLSPRSWNTFRASAAFDQGAIVEKIKKRCPPRAGKNPPSTVEAALTRGNTARANDVLAYINQCDDLVNDAQAHLEQFGHTGDDTSLHKFIEIVTRSGITSVSHSFLFSAMGHDSFAPPDALPERMAQLYGVHPIMNKRHFGKLLQIKFEHHLPLTGGEIVTGLFQQMGSFTAILEPDSIQDFFGLGKLAYFRDWAELRLTLPNRLVVRGSSAAAVAELVRALQGSPRC
jgi:hypothetical protein